MKLAKRCISCEFNFDGICADGRGNYEYGESITDGSKVCDVWSVAFEYWHPKGLYRDDTVKLSPYGADLICYAMENFPDTDLAPYGHAERVMEKLKREVVLVTEEDRIFTEEEALLICGALMAYRNVMNNPDLSVEMGIRFRRQCLKDLEMIPVYLGKFNISGVE
jgi:hypothetical protein